MWLMRDICSIHSTSGWEGSTPSFFWSLCPSDCVCLLTYLVILPSRHWLSFHLDIILHIDTRHMITSPWWKYQHLTSCIPHIHSLWVHSHVIWWYSEVDFDAHLFWRCSDTSVGRYSPFIHYVQSQTPLPFCWLLEFVATLFWREGWET